MHLWDWPMTVPIFLGYYRFIENISLTFDFMLFEIFMCAALYLFTRAILFMKVMKLEKANREANEFFNHLSQEPNSMVQNKCLLRCLNMSDAALNQYDSLLLYFGNLERQPSRKVCLQRWPQDFQLMKAISTEESFACLQNKASVKTLNDSTHKSSSHRQFPARD